jgi:hypothetical protein
MTGETIAIGVTILLALVGYALKYLNDLRLAQRKDRLDRINLQLRELYGPLVALNAASFRLWGVFLKRHQSDMPPALRDPEAWRLWMTMVFIPLNREMRSIVAQHADLLRDPGGMPECLTDLSAHVAGYEIVAEKWRTGNFDPHNLDENVSVVDFPQDVFAKYVDSAFRELKAEQERLLRDLSP